MARAPPDGWRARGVVFLLKDNLLACRAGGVSEVDPQSLWNVACPEVEAVGDL